MNRGIVILAIGDAYYGKAAFNLAISLKVHEPVSVSLIYDHAGVSHLSDGKLTFFDHLIPLPAGSAECNGKAQILRPKTLLYELSPYDETIFMDADTLWNPTKRVQNLFDELSPCDFTMANRGYSMQTEGMTGFALWADIAEIRSTHGIEKYPDLSSEFIYWKKCEAAQAIFTRAKDIFDTDPITYRYFAGGKPDEPAFAIALSQLKYDLHKMPFYPGYWYYHTPQKTPSRSEIVGKYWYFSFGGNQMNHPMKKLYHDVSSDCAYRLGVGAPFPLLDKNKSIKERIPV